MEKRKLIVSYQGLIHSIQTGCLTQSTLRTALFFLVCRRAYAYNPSIDGPEHNELVGVSLNPHERRQVLEVVKNALIPAEVTNRVLFLNGQEGTVAQLNDFLRAHNLKPVPGFDPRLVLNAKTIKEAVETYNPSLEVIY